jgi:hypothetical protein
VLPSRRFVDWICGAEAADVLRRLKVSAASFRSAIPRALMAIRRDEQLLQSSAA